MGMISIILSIIFITGVLAVAFFFSIFQPWLLAVVIFYAAFAVFLVGFIYRIIKWALIPVPYSITATCGQQKSLPWIKVNAIENPSGKAGVIVRMVLEVLLFRSLFRNTNTEMYEGRPIYGKDITLWLFGLLFHITLLIIVMRHLRFFMEPVPAFINTLSAWDGMFELGVPTFYLSDILFAFSALYLFLRRVAVSRLRYISLAQDYIPLLLLICVAGSGILMRHIYKVDLLKVKELTTGWTTFSGSLPEGIGLIFFIHLFFICVLLFWFPFAKLMHMGGILLSPTRYMANNSRMKRHVNPLNVPFKVHTYEEYEDEFRDKMKTAGLPVDKG